MKKTLALGTAVLLLLCLLAACSDTAASSASVAASSTPTVKGELAPPNKDIKIGVVYITDPAEGIGYSFAHDKGIRDMQLQLELENHQIVRKINVADADTAAAEKAMRECIDEGCTIIFATSYGYMDACAKLAEEFPDVYFLHCSGSQTNGSNFTHYFGRIYQARYLTGMAAAMKSQSGKLGYVAAMGRENSEVTSGLNAFAMGAYSVDPDCKVLVKVTGSWYDAAAEEAAAQELIDLGCDVIAQHCDTSGPQAVAQANEVWGIGYNSDMSIVAPMATVTSVIWHWGVYYTACVKSILDGSFTAEPYFGGMAEGLVDISPLNPEVVADGTEDALGTVRSQMERGEFMVFEGVLETNEDGVAVGKDGAALPDEDIQTGINWYFKNVVEV